MMVKRKKKREGSGRVNCICFGQNTHDTTRERRRKAPGDALNHHANARVWALQGILLALLLLQHGARVAVGGGCAGPEIQASG